jgi:inhibitor of cysteine peptidase
VATITLTGEDKGRTIDVPVGSTIEVRLAENPTTGYRWAVESAGGPAIAGVDDRFEPEQPPRIGSGGIRVFRFRATKQGGGVLALRHWQPWSGESSIIERFSVDLEVTR